MVTNITKKKFRLNITRIFVGMFFLFFSFQYLESHAAEKASLLSGLDMMAQRIHVLTYKLMGKDYYSLEEKYLIVRRLEEVAYTAEFTDACDDSLYIDRLREKILEIRQKEVDEDFRMKIPLYFSYLFEAQDYVVNECKQLE